MSLDSNEFPENFRSKKFHCNFFAFETAFFVMNFQKNFKKGGGVISDLKNFIANLVPAQPVCGKNRNEIFRKRGGGGSKAVRKFSGNSFESGETGFPKVVRWRGAIYKKREQKFGVCQNVKISPTLGLQKAS